MVTIKVYSICDKVECRSWDPILKTWPELLSSSFFLHTPHLTGPSETMATKTAPTTQTSPAEIPPSVFTLPHTAQLEALYTIIRDKKTSRGDFLFYSDRIIRLLVEEGLNHLPVVSKTVETPTVSTSLSIRRLFILSTFVIYVLFTGCGIWRCWLRGQDMWCVNLACRGGEVMPNSSQNGRVPILYFVRPWKPVCGRFVGVCG